LREPPYEPPNWLPLRENVEAERPPVIPSVARAERAASAALWFAPKPETELPCDRADEAKLEFAVLVRLLDACEAG
jgi:hypothetical protein